MTRESIKVTGLREFQKSLKQMDADLPRQLRLVLNDAGQIIIDYARPRIPSRTGQARASVKLRSSQRAVRLAVGGSRAPYYPWLDFGGEGRVRGRPSHRPFLSGGRYVYAGLAAKRPEILEVMQTGLTDLARSAGLEVS